MHKPLHLSDDIDSLHVPIKEGGRGRVITEDRVDASTPQYTERKHHKQHKDPQKKNNQETKIDRKINVWIF